MMRYSWLRQLERGFDLANTHFSFGEEKQNFDPVGIPEHPKKSFSCANLSQSFRR